MGRSLIYFWGFNSQDSFILVRTLDILREFSVINAFAIAYTIHTVLYSPTQPLSLAVVIDGGR